MTNLTFAKVCKKFSKDFTRFVAAILYLTTTNIYWFLRGIFTFSRNLPNRRFVQQHQTFFFLHDLVIDATLLLAVWLLLFSAGRIDIMTATGLKFYYEVSRSIMMFAGGISIISTIGSFNNWAIYKPTRRR